MPYSIKERLKNLDFTCMKLFKAIFDDREALERVSDGGKLTYDEVSKAISGYRRTPKSEKICKEADRIVTKWETERGWR